MDASAVDQDRERVQAEHVLAATPLLEVRAPHLRALPLPGQGVEPVLKRHAQGNDLLMRGALRLLEHPGELLTLDGAELPAKGAFRGLGQTGGSTMRLVLLVPLRKRPVSSEPGHPHRLGEVLLLPSIGHQSDLVASEHEIEISRSRLSRKSRSSECSDDYWRQQVQSATGVAPLHTTPHLPRIANPRRYTSNHELLTSNLLLTIMSLTYKNSYKCLSCAVLHKP